MTEKQYRIKIIALLKPVFAFAVENAVADGAPDICCPAGWIEVKLGKWPKTDRGAVKIALRPAQRIWMRNWIHHGGKCWTITIIENEWFMHNGEWARQFLGLCGELDFRASAVVSWNSWNHEPTATQLIAVLTNTKVLASDPQSSV